MSATQSAAAVLVDNFLGGKHVTSDAPPAAEVCNPATGEVLALTPAGGPAEVDAAVRAASAAFPAWSATPVTQRARILFRCRHVLGEHTEELSRLISLENGKTLDEARGDVTRGLEVLDFACHAPHLLKGESLPDVAEQLDGTPGSLRRNYSLQFSRDGADVDGAGRRGLRQYIRAQAQSQGAPFGQSSC
jgi:acyl-CoA reductase-like NAD-dependent aldehyde dehydrogenase